MDYPIMLIGGGLLVVCIALLFLWLSAESRLIRTKKKNIEK